MTKRSTLSLLLPPVLDGLIAALAVFAAYQLRFDRAALEHFGEGAYQTAPLAALCVPLANAACGLYPAGRRLWPIRLLLGGLLGFAAAAAAVWLIFGFGHISRFSFTAAALLAMLTSGAYRALGRIRSLVATSRDEEAQFDDLVEQDRSVGLNLLKLWRYRELVRNLVWKDLKLKYRGSALGFIWSLANPILMLIVYTLAFTYIMGLRRQGFVYFLLLGMLPWTFFSTTTMMATGAIVDSGGLLRSVRFPRTVLPVATVLFNLAQYLLTFAVLLPLMLVVFRVTPSVTMLAFPIILVLLVVFTTGAALIVAAATAFFRDVKHLVEIGLAALFWMTPILYDLADVPPRLRLPILLSPMSPFVAALHDVFYHRVWPDPAIWTSAFAWAIAAFIGGVSLFLSYEDRFAENV